MISAHKKNPRNLDCTSQHQDKFAHVVQVGAKLLRRQLPYLAAHCEQVQCEAATVQHRDGSRIWSRGSDQREANLIANKVHKGNDALDSEPVGFTGEQDKSHTGTHRYFCMMLSLLCRHARRQASSARIEPSNTNSQSAMYTST